MRKREVDVFNYYDDGGAGRGQPQDQFDALVSLTYNAGAHGSRNVYTLVDTGRPAEAAAEIRTMTSTHVNGKKVLARGLISRRAGESAPFQAAAKAAAVAKK